MNDLQRTLPNTITIGRLVLSVVFFVVISGVACTPGEDPSRAWWAVWIFIVAAVTDLLDGYLARKWKVVSPFGRILDPVVDKILVIGCTTNPGDCQRIQDTLRDRGVHVLYNPEFIAQGSILYDLQHADMVLIGSENQAVMDQYAAIYNHSLY